MNIQPSIDLKKVNLQTAVGYLVSLHENEYQWNLLGVRVVGVAPTGADIPEGTYEYGDAYEVGTEPPYDLYIYTRPDGVVHTEGYWFNTGKFPMPGPQGPKGDGLEQINKWTNGTVGNVTYNTTDGAKVTQTTTVNYTDSTDGSTKQQQLETTTTLPIVPGKYISMNATSDNKKMEVKVDDTALALDYIKINKTLNYDSTFALENGKPVWYPTTQYPQGNSFAWRNNYGDCSFHIVTMTGFVTPDSNQIIGYWNIWRDIYDEGLKITKTTNDTGTLTVTDLEQIQSPGYKMVNYDDQLYYRYDPREAPDGTLNFIHLDRIEDGNGGYKATGKCFSITVSTREWKVVNLNFGSGIYQHKIGFTLDGTNSWYITLVLTTSSAQAITQTTLYKYLPNIEYPLIGGNPVDCYRSAVQNPSGFGNGRMSATYNADTQTATYYFALSNENTQETVSTTNASISGFIDTVTEI